VKPKSKPQKKSAAPSKTKVAAKPESQNQSLQNQSLQNQSLKTQAAAKPKPQQSQSRKTKAVKSESTPRHTLKLKKSTLPAPERLTSCTQRSAPVPPSNPKYEKWRVSSPSPLRSCGQEG